MGAYLTSRAANMGDGGEAAIGVLLSIAAHLAIIQKLSNFKTYENGLSAQGHDPTEGS